MAVALCNRHCSQRSLSAMLSRSGRIFFLGEGFIIACAMQARLKAAKPCAWQPYFSGRDGSAGLSTASCSLGQSSGEKKFSRLVYRENERILEYGMHEQIDLVELCMTHYITRKLFRWYSRDRIFSSSSVESLLPCVGFLSARGRQREGKEDRI